jgi:hypothetical protein
MGIGIERVKKSRTAAAPEIQRKKAFRCSVIEIRKVLLLFETQAFHTEIDFNPCIQTISRASQALKPTKKPDVRAQDAN